MKLYTEEEVRKAYIQGWIDVEQDRYSNISNGLTGILRELTPIELPSDEEIEKGVNCSNLGLKYDYNMSAGFKKGAKWMRAKIQGGSK